MDSLDIRIIRTMGVQPYGPTPRSPECLQARHIAKVLGMSPEAVRDRVARMEEAKVICGYEVFPNIRHFGLTSSLFFARFGDEAEVEAAVDRIAPLEGLTATYQFLAPILGVELAHRNAADLDRKLRLLRSLLPGGTVEKVADAPMPPIDRPLTHLDWRIIQALRGDARRPLREVGEALKVSTRTVKRRFDRMASEGSFFIIPLVDPAAVPGLILFELMLHLTPEAGQATIREVHRVLDSNLVCVDRPSEPEARWYAAGLYANGIGEVDALRKRAAAIPGVERVEPFILRGSTENYTWLDEAVATQVEASGVRARGAPEKAES